MPSSAPVHGRWGAVVGRVVGRCAQYSARGLVGCPCMMGRAWRRDRRRAQRVDVVAPRWCHVAGAAAGVVDDGLRRSGPGRARPEAVRVVRHVGALGQRAAAQLAVFVPGPGSGPPEFSRQLGEKELMPPFKAAHTLTIYIDRISISVFNALVSHFRSHLLCAGTPSSKRTVVCVRRRLSARWGGWRAEREIHKR